MLPLFWPGTCANTYMPVTMQAEALTGPAKCVPAQTCEDGTVDGGGTLLEACDVVGAAKEAELPPTQVGKPMSKSGSATKVRGMYCSAVGADSAAEKAGIMTGDIIVRVDGTECCCDVLQFKSFVAEKLARYGSVVMRINRNGVEMSRTVRRLSAW